MDFLDPKKQRMHKIRLLVGYVLIGIAVLIATVILLYQAYGFGIDNKGNVIQNGWLFVSSRPSPADVYINGARYKSQTDTRVQLPAEKYTVKLTRSGYRDWQRDVTINGGDVQHFDYPLLVPQKLSTTSLKQYDTTPNVTSQSPDKRWLVLQTAADFTTFEVFDLSKPKEPPAVVSLPADTITASDGAQAWHAVEWSRDNRHLLLKHDYQKAGQTLGEFVLFDHEEPAQSINLSRTLNTNPTKVALQDGAYDQYYLYDQTNLLLAKASLRDPNPTAFLEHVLDFKPYDSNGVLYVTDVATTAGKVAVQFRQGDDTYNIREILPSASYLLDIARYKGNLYAAVGTPVENKVYLYKNPTKNAQNGQKNLLPLRTLRLAGPTYVAFAPGGQYILVENGTHCLTYDFLATRRYEYQLSMLDEPRLHVRWTDSAHLQFVSGGKLILSDYDGINQQILQPSLAGLEPVFDQDATFAYSFVAQSSPATAEKPAANTYTLTSTALRTPQDQ